MEKMTFNEFCYEECDRLYDPRFTEEEQCSGYKLLKKMVVEGVKPATYKEMNRWETSPTLEELHSVPDIKYLRFLHPILRYYILPRWNEIKNMQV